MVIRKITFMAMVAVGCFVSIRSESQDLPKIVPASPNAATLGKYGDIPVSLYSGTADITIPLYEIKSGDISVPITLSYHTGGIRLNELAGWTGLGFAFNAGGVISRNVLGFDDLSVLGPTTRPELASTANISSTSLFFGAMDESKVIRSVKNEEFSYKNIFGTMEAYDLEYDIFNYNFLGRTGRFIVNHAGQVVQQKEEDIRIELIGPEDYYHRFKITDEQGVIYYFKAIETAAIEWQSSQAVTSWYLTRIESPKGYWVDFAYNGGSSPTIGQTQESSIIACRTSPGATVETTSSSMSYSNALMLDSITFDNGSVDVLYDAVREDYRGQRIMGLKIRSKTSGKIIKEVAFEYDYFMKNTSRPGVQYKRLKLINVTETANGIELPPYSFSYYEPESEGDPQFMYVGSYSIDHWGYYNRTANTGLLPAFSGNINVGVGDNFQTLPGAKREAASGSAGKAFSLRQIIYPIGGSTVLDVETNTYDISYGDVVADPEPVYVQQSARLLFDKPGLQSGTIDLTKANGPISVNIGFMPSSAQKWSSAKRLPEDAAWVEIGPIRRSVTGDIVNQQCPGNSVSVCSLVYQLDDPGIYNFSGFLKDGIQIDTCFSLISVQLEWMEKQFQQDSNEDKVGYGGGLRIKAITNYDEKGNIVGQKSYNYHYRTDTNDDGYDELHSYGRQISNPLYSRYDLVAQADGNGTTGSFCVAFSRYSNSVVPLTTSVGYDQVMETVLDNTRRNSNSQTLHVFENKADSVYQYSVLGEIFNSTLNVTGMHPFGVQNVSYQTNGLLKSRIDYVYVDSVYQPVREINNTWVNRILMNYYSIKQEYFTMSTGVRLVMAYPALRSERIVLERTKTTQYDLQNNNTALITEDVFEYGTVHTQQIRHTRTESSGKTVSEYKIYPPDYGNLATTAGGVKLLQDKHVIGSPVEEYVAVRETPSSPDKIVKANLTTYKTDFPLPDVIYRMESVTAPPLSSFKLSNREVGTFLKDTLYKPILQFVNYTDRGNVKQMAKDRNVNFAYKWQYNESYPTAECKNCVAGKFLYEGFEETTSNTASEARTGRRSYAAVYTVVVPDAGPYALTYWQKTGTDKWRLVQINNVTSSRTIGGSGVYIDEVRLFPAGASMATYTYDPLVGMTSMTDANNITVYYEYDALQRLTLIKDQDGNIVKRYTYNYFLK